LKIFNYAKKIKERYKEWVDNDTIGYATECKCGVTVTGWSEKEANENWAKHICKPKKKVVRK